MKKFLTILIVIVLLFGVTATLERQLTPDSSTPQTTQSLMDFGDVIGTWFQGMVDSFKMFIEGLAELAEGKTGDDAAAEEETDFEIGEISADELPEEAQNYYRRYVSEDWQTVSEDLEGKTQAGEPFENMPRSKKETKLPEVTEEGTPITYQEFDAETTLKGRRGTRRFVHGSDGSTYYTEDHYQNYKKVID